MMDMDDYEIDDLQCPACGNPVTHSDRCLLCDEMNEVVDCCDDLCVGAGRCIHGDGMAPCPECSGTGIRRWCPKCHADYWLAKETVRDAINDKIESELEMEMGGEA